MAITLTAVVVSFVAVAGAIGTTVYDQKSEQYARQSQDRHPITAVAVKDSTMPTYPDATTHAVSARWTAAGSVHTAVFPSSRRVSAGEEITIWVNADGKPMPAPQSPSDAAKVATGVAVLSWLAVLNTALLIMYLVHRFSDRTRFRQWDNELAQARGRWPAH
ncbi:hypothetical protein ACN27E_07390 [Mycobacterium sp. WMMD1722]|uniref:Rv1733c family protein n=1 Tax=Mycobacterium sp. WMMD1722 TaxID=3404117 RepID=UPI003BF4E865